MLLIAGAARVPPTHSPRITFQNASLIFIRVKRSFREDTEDTDSSDGRSQVVRPQNIDIYHLKNQIWSQDSKSHTQMNPTVSL